MIPKIIHACWFGNAKMPEEQVKYIEGWKKILPDYEIKIWTDESFSQYLDNSIFVQDAIRLKKYAFLSDYFRLIVLYEFGGIYFDTDVEVKKSFDDLLDCKMFIGYIFDCLIGTAVIGSEKNNPLLKKWVNILESDYEENKNFTINNIWITQYFIDNFDDFKLNGKRLSLSSGIEVYPRDFFEKYQINKKSGGGYSEHHCYGSWRNRNDSFLKKLLKRILPKSFLTYINHKRCLKKNQFYNIYKQSRKL